MWQAIASNRRRSWILILGMALLLGGTGFAFGAAHGVDGGLIGLGVALGLVFLLWGGSKLQGDTILLATAGGSPVTRTEAPQLCNIVEEMTIASGMGTPPAVYLIPSDMPNAFAVGTKGKCAVAVTSGLLRRLNRDELQGVIAHEIGHIKNEDTSFMTMASIMLSVIVLLSEIFWRSMRRGGLRVRGKGGGQAQLLFLVIGLLLAVIAPICAQMLYFACSRRREYLADASGACFTRYPEGLASALEKIETAAVGRHGEVSKALAPLYIVNPLQLHSMSGFSSTHPPTSERVKILRAMGGGAGYTDYERAYKSVRRSGGGLIDARSVRESGSLAAREATPPEKNKIQQERVREVMDMIGRLDNLLLLTCACGMRIKTPPDYDSDRIACPRCGVVNRLPSAHETPAPSATDPETLGAHRPIEYQRQGTGWESFKCPCGMNLQLSPLFTAPFMICRQCKRRVNIVGGTPTTTS